MDNDTPNRPVDDWFTDYDFFERGYVDDPFPVWDKLRTQCPIARSERWGGSWMVTRYQDVQEVFRDPLAYSNHGGTGNGFIMLPHPAASDGIASPPLSSDPPEHTEQRRVLLPLLSRKSMHRHEGFIRDTARGFARSIAEDGDGDAAGGFAQQIPVRVIAEILGVSQDCVDDLVVWVQGILQEGFTDFAVRRQARRNILELFERELASRRAQPRDDLLTEVSRLESDGNAFDQPTLLGMCLLLLTGGVDTTWSAIGASLHHLATHPDDRRRLVAEPELIPTAVEEFLRAYSPVTSARIAQGPRELCQRGIADGDRVIVNTPAANRDPAEFDRADEVLIDRQRNRHIAFGAGVHRCAGSHLARLEMVIALEEWLAHIPEFELDDTKKPVTWSGGQVRGPRSVPIRVLAAEMPGGDGL